MLLGVAKILKNLCHWFWFYTSFIYNKKIRNGSNNVRHRYQKRISSSHITAEKVQFFLEAGMLTQQYADLFEREGNND